MTTSKQNHEKSPHYVDIKEITDKLNCQLLPQGIEAKVSLKKSRLQVVFESEEIPEEELVVLLKDTITNLVLTRVESVKVYAKQKDSDFIVWSDKFETSSFILNQKASSLTEDFISDFRKDKTLLSKNEKAREGNIEEIQEIIQSKCLDEFEIKSKVSLRNSYLQIALKADQLPEKEEISSKIYREIEKIGIYNAKRLKIYGKQTGKDLKSWDYEIDLSNDYISKKEESYQIQKSSRSTSTNLNTNIPSWEYNKTITEESGFIYSLATSSSGKILVIGEKDNTVRVRNLRTDSTLHTSKVNVECIYSVAVSLDSQKFASSGSESTINVRCLKQGYTIRNLGTSSYGHSGYIHSLAFSPDSKLLASGSADRTVKIWDLETGEVVHTLTGHSGCIWSLAISQNGKYLVSGSGDHTIKIWNLTTGNLIRTLSGHSDSVSTISISSDSQIVASGSFDKTIRIWNLEDTTSLEDSLLWESSKRQSHVGSVSINTDGKTLACMYGNKVIELWDLKTGEIQQTIEGHSVDSWSAGLTAESWSSGLLMALGGVLGVIPTTVHFADKNTLISATHGKIRVWERNEVSPKKTVKYYEDLIYDRKDLASILVSSKLIYEELIYKFALFLFNSIRNEDLVEIINARYNGQSICLIITNKQIIGVCSNTTSTIITEFTHKLKKIQGLSLAKNGLLWNCRDTEYRVYCDIKDLSNKLESIVPFSELDLIPEDKHEKQYQQSQAVQGCGCLIILVGFVAWGFSSCVGSVFKSQPSIQSPETPPPIPSQVQSSPSVRPSQTVAPSPQKVSPSSSKNSESTKSRIFLGRSGTGYELWADKRCVYVKGITTSDLARLNTNIWDFKKEVKSQTGYKCVMFE